MKFNFRFTRSVDSIVGSINRQIAALDKAAEAQRQLSYAKSVQSEKLSLEANAHNDEANRANSVSLKLRKLVA